MSRGDPYYQFYKNAPYHPHKHHHHPGGHFAGGKDKEKLVAWTPRSTLGHSADCKHCKHIEILQIYKKATSEFFQR